MTLWKAIAVRNNIGIYTPSFFLPLKGNHIRHALKTFIHHRYQVRTKLTRLDQYSKTGPWTIMLLTLIRDHPKLKAADLAAKTGEEKETLKLNVRKLKNLGLIISHDPGYTLSPLGIALLSKW